MQRLAVIAAVIAVTMAMVGPAGGQQPGEFDVRLDPAIEGNTAVRAFQRVAISGSAPSGDITEIHLFGRMPDGSLIEQPLPLAIRNRPYTSTGDGVQNNGGELDGRITLGPPFPDQCRQSAGECGPGPVATFVRISIGGQTDDSNDVTVDFYRPEITRYDLAIPDDGEQSIIAVFSEPVRLDRTLPENLLDWQISDPDRQVLAVEARQSDCDRQPFVGQSGCTRRLRYQPPMGEDDTPQVAFANTANQPAYLDRASNGLVLVNQAAGEAIDRIRPARPSIESVDGEDPADPVIGRDDPVTVELGNVADGHQVEVGVDGEVVIEATDYVDGEPLEVPLNGAERAYTITAVAIDPNGNRSDQTSREPQRQDGAPAEASYTLDLTPPRAIGATRADQTDQVIVTFQRPPTLPDDGEEPEQVDEGTWVIAGMEHASVERESDLQLRITFPDAIPAGSTAIGWSPDGESTYTDTVGNQMAALSALPIQPLPPVLSPVFTRPDSTTGYVNADDDPFTVTGALQSGVDPATVNEVEVTLLDADGEEEGQPQSAAVADDGSWSVDVDLPDSPPVQTLRFRAVARSDVGGVSPPRTSSSFVLDREEPVVNLQRPAAGGGGILGGEGGTETGSGPEQVTFFITQGSNFRQATIDLTFTENPDLNTQVIYDGAKLGTEDDPVVVPISIPDGYIGDLEVDVQATDLADNSSEVVDGLFDVIDAINGAGSLTANALGVHASEILVVFPRPLGGTTAATDWSATGGIPGSDSRRNATDAQIVDTDDCEGCAVSVRFSQRFPGVPSDPPADENATPTIDYADGLLTNLQGADGEQLLVLPDVADIDQPDSPTVAAVTGSPARLDRQAPAGTDCNTQPPPDGCPYVATFSGETSASADPNLYVVRRLDGSTPGPVVRTGAAETDGTFTFRVLVEPNATTRFQVAIEDPSGNDAPETAIAEITEDSLGPEVARLVASLRPPRGGQPFTVNIDYRLVDAAAEDQSGNTAALWYRAGEEEFQEIATGLPVDADGDGSYRWRVPAEVDLAQTGLQFKVVGTDALGNVGPEQTAPLDNVPELVSALATSLRRVTVRTSEPVTTEQDGAAGFSVIGGPGVISATSEAPGTIVLALNGDLPTTGDLRVAYSGRGGWTADDLRALRAGSVPLVIDLEALSPITDLAAGPDGQGGAVVSFIDERNELERVQGYEISRDGEVLTTVGRRTRVFFDEDPPDGVVTYAVTTIGQQDGRSETVEVTTGIGPSPVPPDAALAAQQRGPVSSDVVEQCPYPATPNLTSQGGVAVSCDGRMAALVPPGAVAEPVFATFVQRSGPDTPGFAALTDQYQLVAVTEDGFEPVEALGAYAELSVRALAEQLGEVIAERATNERILTDGAEEQAPRTGRESVASQLLTPGTFRTVVADQASLRIFGPDPAIASDRFATAAGLSQTQFRRAGAAVLARADDYPDALASAPLATQVGGPVLLTRTADIPQTTILELRRLEVTEVTLVGGTAAISADAEQQLVDLGYEVRRFGGETRFDTAAVVADQIGSVDGGAFLATGQEFADALSASAPAARIGRPILLTTRDELVPQTTAAITSLGLDTVHLVGGTEALAEPVAEAVAAQGPQVVRSAGATRFETAVDLAGDLVGEGLLTDRRPLMASGDGDGRTSPDALAAGPVGGRLGTPLLLTPRSTLPAVVADYLEAASGVRGLLLAGGPVAVTEEVRAAIDAAAS